MDWKRDNFRSTHISQIGTSWSQSCKTAGEPRYKFRGVETINAPAQPRQALRPADITPHTGARWWLQRVVRRLDGSEVPLLCQRIDAQATRPLGCDIKKDEAV